MELGKNINYRPRSKQKIKVLSPSLSFCEGEVLSPGLVPIEKIKLSNVAVVILVTRRHLFYIKLRHDHRLDD